VAADPRPVDQVDFVPSYTAAELQDLCRSGSERIECAIASGREAAIAEYSKIEEASRWFCNLYAEWIRLTEEYLLTAKGRSALLSAPGPERSAELAVRSGMTQDDLALASAIVAGPDNPLSQAFSQAFDGADSGSALEVWVQFEQVMRKAHDFRRDLITDLLGFVYREHGLSGLEDAQAFAAERGPWVESMPAELALDPKMRLAELSFLLTVTCFFEFRIEELADRWVAWADPCGNCGRQLQDRYRPDEDWGFEIIDLPGPATFGLDAVTVYQSHFALIHHVYAIQAVGVPCPAIRCAGLEAGSKPCEWHVYKDPTRSDPAFYEMVGAPIPGDPGSPSAGGAVG